MIVRILTGTLFTLFVAALLVPGFLLPVLPVLLFTAVSVICTLELANAVIAQGTKVSRPVALVGSFSVLAPLIPLAFRGAPGWRLPALVPFDPSRYGNWQPEMMRLLSEGLACTAFLMIMMSMLLVLATVLAHGPGSLVDGVATSSMVIYVAFPLSCSVLVLYAVPDGFLWMLAAPISAWITDVFAYFSGSLFGRNKLVPIISPKKTLEGAVGGLLACMGIMALYFYLFMGNGWPIQVSSTANVLFGLATGLVCGATAQLGDWLASAVKRWSGVKDFGNVLPGHGGILDRFDSVLFTAPILVLASIVYYLVQPFSSIH